MCGIAVHLAPSTFASALDLACLRHRGPDAQGEWSAPNGHCWLGNTRLAILDLSPTGRQPMVDPANGNVIVLNGEIYNHPDVRAQLGPELTWRGTSDTETILQGYAHWGEKVVERLKGMFAFAIYSQARGELFVARDRLGIKPLYYTVDEGSFRAASEVKVLVEKGATPPPAAIGAFLKYGACPETQNLFPGVEMLPAGHTLTLRADGSRRIERYWPVRNFSSSSTRPAEEVRRLLEKAVEEHLLSDVPVASFLSGGVDSSIITALAAQRLHRKLQTFVVGFDLAGFDESAIAAEVATRYETTHERIQLSENEVLQSVVEAVEKLDLPSVDAINTYIVSRAVAAHGVKVALSGLGGDELFGGYPSFRDVPRLRMLSLLPASARRLLGSVMGMGDRLGQLPRDRSTESLAAWRREFFHDAALRDAGVAPPPLLSQCPVALPDDFARISWVELAGYMRHTLLRDSDQMSMAVSLELRVPFLDHELVEFVLGLPAHEKKRFGPGKGLLVEACRDLLPPSVYQRPKAGFVLPMATWMNGPLADFTRRGIEEVKTRELLPSDFVDQLAGGFERKELHWTRLWSVVVLGHFAKRWSLTRTANETSPLHSFA